MRPCPGCDGRGFVNVGHHTAPEILIPCPHPDHDMKEEDNDGYIRYIHFSFTTFSC
jgi:hypothetical protein